MKIKAQYGQNPRHFILIGNGDGGTSLLRGLLNAHAGIHCLFEDKGGPGKGDPAEELKYWRGLSETAGAKGLIWGNKIPIEQFITRHYVHKEVLRLAEVFKMIVIIRRYSKYWKHRTPVETYRKNWAWLHDIYDDIREAWPTRIIQVSFEDLVIRPKTELCRICDFLGVRYETGMLEGTKDTGYDVYNQAGIEIEKA